MLTLGVEHVVVSGPVEEVQHGLLVVGELVGGGVFVVAPVQVDHRHANTGRCREKKPILSTCTNILNGISYGYFLPSFGAIFLA